MVSAASTNSARTIATFALLASGLSLLLASNWMPWYHIGHLFNVRPECAFSGGPFPPITAGAALVALVLAIVRRPRIVIFPAGLALGLLLLALSQGFYVSENVCGSTSGSGPAYGWLVALAGAALTFVGAIASWRSPSLLRHPSTGE